MPENTVIIDCYTDEPAGLGVPPYLGTYPRYIAGWLAEEGENCHYLTIDDLRLVKQYGGKAKEPKPSEKTNIKIYNLTRTAEQTSQILADAERVIVISGVHTPGKYLSAVPGTIKEVVELVQDISCEKILTGPAVYGTSVEGGRFGEKVRANVFSKIKDFNFSYEEIKEYSVKGAEIIKQIPSLRIIEIETGKGCSRKKGCSFCTEPIKNRLEFRKEEDILAEVSAFSKLGVDYFRFGKQSCFYSYPSAPGLLQKTRKRNKNIKVLHIDNANPANVISKKGQELTKDIVKYCTSGNVAAFGVESFDMEVVEKNNLNSTPEQSYEAVRIINREGAKRGDSGMPCFLPGINLLFGLNGESRQTHDENMKWLKKIMDSSLMLRRINIRQVNIFEGTPLHETVGNKFIRKNKKYYWKWRDEIRQNIDYPMLKRVMPAGTLLKQARAEIYDGKTTFARQIGTYPIIIGIKERIPLNNFFNVEITGHMLRSVTGIVKT
ncbi:radical SAM protein [Candidatus Woesearchaeota archaeon]|nr:radical SAM protein [Candidatus Woesearchaeota archaeon]